MYTNDRYVKSDIDRNNTQSKHDADKSTRLNSVRRGATVCSGKYVQQQTKRSH